MERTFTMRAPESFFEKLDELRRAQDDLPTRAEMVRRIVERAGAQAVEAEKAPASA